jgi:hypothetical protein
MMTPQYTIFALTLIRPWCWAIVHGFKTIENRVWTPPENVMGQRIAIHSGQKYEIEAANAIDSVIESTVGPATNIEGIAPVDTLWPGGRLVGSVRVAGYARHDGRGHVLGYGGVSQAEAVEAAASDWTSSQPGVAWILRDAIALDAPVAGVRGYQKLWLVEQGDYGRFAQALQDKAQRQPFTKINGASA